MSSQGTTSNQQNALFINTDTSKTFIVIKATERESYINNSSYNPITLYMGTVMGRITSTGVLVPWRNDVTDGSQYPVGLLGADMVIDSGDTVAALLVTECRMAAEMVIAYQLSNQSIATTLQLQITLYHGAGTTRLKDALEAIGCHLETTTQMSFPDNA